MSTIELVSPNLDDAEERFQATIRAMLAKAKSVSTIVGDAARAEYRVVSNFDSQLAATFEITFVKHDAPAPAERQTATRGTTFGEIAPLLEQK